MECYNLDLPALTEIADRIGPTPQQLHQDPELRTPPNAKRTARWWIDEYGCELQY